MYPSTEQVIEAVSKTNVDWYIPVVKSWKTNYYNRKWSKETNEYKLLALQTLASLIKASSPSYSYTVIVGDQYCFRPWLNQIELGQNPSILSTLHEIGHAIWGPSELDACRFSVAIFKTVFPKEFSQLEWKGHMLFRKQT